MENRKFKNGDIVSINNKLLSISNYFNSLKSKELLPLFIIIYSSKNDVIISPLYTSDLDDTVLIPTNYYFFFADIENSIKINKSLLLYQNIIEVENPNFIIKLLNKNYFNYLLSNKTIDYNIHPFINQKVVIKKQGEGIIIDFNENEFLITIKFVDGIIKKYKIPNCLNVLSFISKDKQISDLLEIYKKKSNTLPSNNKSNPNPKVLYKNIDFKDCIVKNTLGSCIHKNHNISPAKLSVHIINNMGYKMNKTYLGNYCKTCDKCFITNSTFQSIKQSGSVLCKIIDETKQNQSEGVYANWNTESELASYGYNVRHNDLSVLQRREILKLLIDNQVLNKDDIIKHLEMLISFRRNQTTMKEAIEKWESDIEWIKQYNEVYKSTYKINRIIKK